MADDFAPLSELIEQLSSHTRAHICIHDVSGILDAGIMQLDSRFRIHSQPFCSAAKTTPNGFRMCIRCKMRANKKAAAEKRLFHAYCPYGLYEIVKPVLIDGRTQCILYIGNLIFSPEESVGRIARTCRLTKSPEEALCRHLKDAERITSPDAYIRMADCIDSYIRLLAAHIQPPEIGGKRQLHWAVSALQNYIQTNFNQNLSLREAARLYFVNEKYIGRLFKQQTGHTFHEYLNNVRLEKAAAYLLDTRINMISVALSSGFQNVAYFNRLFRRKYGMSPSGYRRRHEAGG